jgi:tripartite-type tricarboxylate transporter receptor subunit TctC
MKILRRRFLHLAAGAVALPTVSRIARAQSYPVRPVRLIVGLPAGGSTDIAARLIGQWLSDRLGQQFIVENRPGAGGNIAAEAAVRAPSDGYTFLIVGASNTINTTLYEKLNFDLIRDIVPVASIVRVPLVMEVTPSFQVNTVPEFIAYAKTNPGKINMGSAGIGNTQHVAGELFKMMASIAMLHVPYRGEAPALTDLLGGQVQIMFGGVAASLEHIRSGTLRPLAVTTTARLELLPQLPSVSEFLPGYEATSWYGVGAPRGTPTVIVDRLNKEINAGLANPQLISRFNDLGVSVLAGSPGDFGKLIANETEKWAKVVKFAGAKAE